MSQHCVRSTSIHPRGNARRAAIAVYVAICVTFVIGFAALAIDIGMLYTTQAEMQRAADSAAMAAAWELLGEERLLGEGYEGYLCELARDSAVSAAARNPVLRSEPMVHWDEDVDIGYLNDLTYVDDPVFTDGIPPNAIRIRIRRDSERGGSISLYFARFLGADSKDLMIEAVAGFADGIVGYEVTDLSGNAQLLPFALHTDSWSGLLDGSVSVGDNYSYDPDTGTVSPGSDGVLELNLYPGAGANQLPPGNYGTVDIGSNNNSSADIARQILYGVNADDLSYFGGQLLLGEDGTLLLNGDTGLSAGFKDELEDIKGQPRAIPIFSQVSGNGNNAMYTVVGFAGIRIMNVKFTGPMSQKELIIQTGVVVDDATLTEPGPGPSYYVYAPVRLVR